MSEAEKPPGGGQKPPSETEQVSRETKNSPGPEDKAEGVSLMVGASKMRASVELDFKYSKEWSPDRLRKHIMSEGIVFGIDEQSIKDLFEQKMFNKPVVVAKGTPAKNGEDGAIQYHVDLDCLRGRPKVLETGGVNLRDLGLFQAVEAGQLLAERIPPTQGRPGRDVYGNELSAADGKEAKLSGGKNTNLSEDGNQLTAAINGSLTGTPDKIEVVPALSISGDVSYKTGNIASNVAVVITGGVLPDFTVRADDDVNITGLVESAEIISGGRIAINAGIQGNGKALLVAEKEILARFANEATLKSKGDIVIQGPVTHCNIEAEGHLIVEGKKATILGGNIYANQGVTADTIGSEMGVKTYIRVGPRIQEMNDAIVALEQKRTSLSPNVAKLKQLLGALAKIKAKMGSLPSDKQAMMAKVKKTYEVLTSQVAAIEQELKELTAERERQMAVQRSVNVKGYTFPGVQIRILNETFAPKNPMKSCTFAIIDGEIQTFPFRDHSKEEKAKK